MNRYNAINLYPKDRGEMKELFARFGASEEEKQGLIRRYSLLFFHVWKLSYKAAQLLKHEMEEIGGEVLLVKETGRSNAAEEWDALILGSRDQIYQLTLRLKDKPYGLKRLGVELFDLLQRDGRGKSREIPLPHGALPLSFGEKTLVMGILNVTPDSFSDGGKYTSLERAVARAEEMVAEGADIIDVGGESTRPGYQKVTEEEELKRVIPVIEALAKRLTVPISIDTYKAAVAKRAYEAGAHILNDIWGAKEDPHMSVVVAETGAPIILMHNRKVAKYRDLISDMMSDLRVSIDLILAAGGKEEQVIIDPGIGFAKNVEENLEVMHHLRRFTSLGYPLLLGTSRKSMIGKTLDLPVEERLEGTIATVVYGITQGVDIVRVHDVKEVSRAVRMADAMIRRGWNHG